MTWFNILLILGGLLLVILLFLWVTYNSFIRSRNAVKTDFADIDVQLKRRASLIENLVAVVREYAKHEKETLENVTAARSQLEKPHGPKQAEKIDNMLTSTLRSLFAVSENYPKLQATENYQRLQNDLKETENLIASYREQYNETVLAYNTLLQTFPNLLAASLFGFQEEELFLSEPEDRKDIKISSK
jgi:LemA protein